VTGNALLSCRASGDPPPDIVFHKDSVREPFTHGAQQDTRIFSEQRKDGRFTTAIIKINDILRTDDGLYKCIAYNRRTRSKGLSSILYIQTASDLLDGCDLWLYNSLCDLQRNWMDIWLWSTLRPLLTLLWEKLGLGMDSLWTWRVWQKVFQMPPSPGSSWTPRLR